MGIGLVNAFGGSEGDQWLSYLVFRFGQARVVINSVLRLVMQTKPFILDLRSLTSMLIKSVKLLTFVVMGFLCFG